jgi:hypothetical protein
VIGFDGKSFTSSAIAAPVSPFHARAATSAAAAVHVIFDPTCILSSCSLLLIL